MHWALKFLVSADSYQYIMHTNSYQILIASLVLLSAAGKILQPSAIAHLMYTTEITGVPDVLLCDQDTNSLHTTERFTITMEKTTQKMLPGNLPETTIYAYGGMTKKGKVSSFPGPMIFATEHVPSKVLWRNNITGKHMLPIDFNQPFKSDDMFINQVPTVPHAHGMATKYTSDGGPRSYWTSSGQKSPHYHTEEECHQNEAVYIYANEEDGLFWYHDHAYGITRLNVYAGLVGMYEVRSQETTPQEQIIKEYYGQNIPRLYFTVADRSFRTDGELYYPDKAFSKDFNTWNPQFYGNMMTVNGKVWPKISLHKQKYRLILLNACQCRYLNIFFLNHDKKLPFQLLRLESDHFSSPVITSAYLLSPGARVELMVDLTQVNGVVMLKNNAAAPYPLGDPDNLIDRFTGSIMKIHIKSTSPLPYLKLDAQANSLPMSQDSEIPEGGVFNRELRLQENFEYPNFPEGQPVYTTLNELTGEDQELSGMFIDGAGMELGADCKGSTFDVGKVYDFHIINLTPDAHPIHIHLVNMQKVKSYKFDVDQYTKDWYQLNGGDPGPRGFDHVSNNMDPSLYKIGPDIAPKTYERVFRDIIDALPDLVTVVRMKFSLNNGQSFPFDVKDSVYVWHCHMLEHEDNEMMKYFCVR